MPLGAHFHAEALQGDAIDTIRLHPLKVTRDSSAVITAEELGGATVSIGVAGCDVFLLCAELCDLVTAKISIFYII